MRRASLEITPPVVSGHVNGRTTLYGSVIHGPKDSLRRRVEADLTRDEVLDLALALLRRADWIRRSELPDTIAIDKFRQATHAEVRAALDEALTNRKD